MDMRRAAFARAILPDGSTIPGGDEQTVDAVVKVLDDLSPYMLRGFDAALSLLERASLLSTGRPFSRLDFDEQQALLCLWQKNQILGPLLDLVALAFKGTHFDGARVHHALGCQYEKGGPAPPARWLAQVVSGDELRTAREVECDVVVVGSGAGGAMVGRELALRGHAVVFLEEGELHRRDAFTGRAHEAKRRFYRGKGTVSTVGNTVIPTFMGRLVGGSTAINAATCFRPPDRVLDEWCERLGTSDFEPQAFEPHLLAVERQLQVAAARPEPSGGPARVMARGCDRLGWRHGPVQRNAPDCDGQGCCDFGCPSGAKRSADVALLPSALGRGALLYTGVRGERVWIEQGRAVGVEARATATGAGLRIRARAVVLAGGAVPTPLFLLRQGICNGSGEVGRNLSLHPMAYISAPFDERIAGHEAIPQSCFSDHFHRDGILLLGSSPPLSGAAVVLPFVGTRLMAAMERFDQVATLGVLVEDEGRGCVRLVGGRELLTYRLRPGDVARIQRGLCRAGEIFLAAGADELYPLLSRPEVLAGHAGLRRFRERRLSARELLTTSFHPLGTCAMGRDPKSSVVGLDHETHEVRDLFVVDGSTVPGPPGVNPQITIMAMAHRAAAGIAAKLN